MVEQLIRNEKVGGSTPLSGTINSTSYEFFLPFTHLLLFSWGRYGASEPIFTSPIGEYLIIKILVFNSKNRK